MIRPPFNESRAIEAANAISRALNSKDPASIVTMLSHEVIWRDGRNLVVGRQEVWDRLERLWSRALHCQFSYEVAGARSHEIDLDFVTEWQHSKQGQWFRTLGTVAITYNDEGIVRSISIQSEDHPIFATERRINIQMKSDAKTLEKLEERRASFK